MGFLKYFFLTIVTVVLVTFCVVNRGSVSIDLFPFQYSTEIPIFVFALLCLSSGVIVSGIIINIKSLKTKCVLKKLQRRIDALENETKVLRSESEFTISTPAIRVNSK